MMLSHPRKSVQRNALWRLVVGRLPTVACGAFQRRGAATAASTITLTSEAETLPYALLATATYFPALENKALGN